MAESWPAAGQPGQRYPLSFTQEWFLTLDQGDDGGTFGRRFTLVRPIRITGPVNIPVLQGALNDVVARHELLRTIVVRDADPPYQEIFPPCPVPLHITTVPPAASHDRDSALPGLHHVQPPGIPRNHPRPLGHHPPPHPHHRPPQPRPELETL
jgi:hypothetical protein